MIIAVWQSDPHWQRRWMGDAGALLGAEGEVRWVESLEALGVLLTNHQQTPGWLLTPVLEAAAQQSLKRKILPVGMPWAMLGSGDARDLSVRQPPDDPPVLHSPRALRLWLDMTAERSRGCQSDRSGEVRTGEDLAPEGFWQQVLSAKLDWEGAVDSLPDPVVLLDPTGTVMRANLAFAQLAGQRVQDVVGEKLEALLGPLPPSPPPSASEEPLTGAVALAVAPDHYFRVRRFTVRSGASSELLLLRDVTLERRLFRQLVMRERLVALGELTACILHDLGNLLTSPMQVLDLVGLGLERLDALSSALPPAQAREFGLSMEELRQDIRTTAQGLSRIDQMVASTRQFSDLRPSNEVAFTLVDLDDVLAALPMPYQHRLRARGVRLELDLAGSLPWIYAKRSELLRVFENLLSNALEFSPPGGWIRIGSAQVGTWLEAWVSDSGQGVPEPLVPHIFELGFTTRGESGGTGIGLYLCRQVIEAHAGTITYESAGNSRHRFLVRLPIDEAMLQQ